MVSTWRLFASALALAACAPRAITYDVSVVTNSCDTLTDPLAGASFLRLRVTGPGIARPREATASVASKHLLLPDVPAGSDRMIEVRAYEGDPNGGGRVVSLGRSGKIEIPDAIPAAAPAPITVFLRRVNAFSAPVAPGDSKCQLMRVARAGHSATLLKNGKVFIAGGFTLRSGSEKVALAEAELFNPATGTFEPARDLSFAGVTQERAYHTATLVPTSGQVALWGGERYAPDGGAPTPRGSLLFYDAEADDYAALPTSTPLPRSHHGATLDVTGRLFVAGGLGSSGRALGEIEWFDPATTQYAMLDGVLLPRLDAIVSTLEKGAVVAVAGGSDGTQMMTELGLFHFSGGTFVRDPSVTLPEPGRRAAGSAPLRGGADLLLLGGYSDPGLPRALASSEVVVGGARAVATGPNIVAVGDVCAVTLTDGRVVAIGGRTADEAGDFPHATGQTLVVSEGAQGALSSLGGPDLPVPRLLHTCTALPDGTVLVTGGVNENGTEEVLQDAWIYQPAPLD